MVFSPCPRSQRSKDSTPNARGTPLPNDLPHQDPPSRPSSAALGTQIEERLAFEAIFRPSTPRAGDPEPEIALEIQQTLRADANRTKQIHPKPSRISLIQLSHKIRRRLSRESPLSKKSSKKFKDRGLTVQDGDQNANPATGMDITTTSDAEYDSDARYILTPQIAERISSGILGVPSNPRSVLWDIGSAQGSSEPNYDMFSTGFDGTASAVWDETPNSEKVLASNLDSILANSRGLDKFDGYNSSLRPHLQPASRRFMPIFAPGSPTSSTERHKAKGDTGIHSAPRFGSPGSRFSPEHDLAFANDRRALAPVPSIPHQAKIISEIVKNRSESPTPELELELSLLKADNDPAGHNRKEAEDSESFVRDSKQTRSRRTSSAPCQNSATWEPSNKYRAQSRFIESFDYVYSSSASDLVISSSDSGQKFTKTKSVSDGWLSDGKRLGYGYRFVREEDEKSAHSEPLGLRPQTGWLTATNAGQLDTVKLSGSQRRLICASQDSGESTAGSQQARACALSREEIVPQMNSTGSQQDPCDSVDSTERVFSSWTRFPSHSKTTRNESAGLSDQVVARDFEPTEKPKANAGTNDTPFPQVPNDKNDSRTSSKKGTRLFSWTRFHRSDNVDRRRYRAGHRRETSRSNELRDPDLEIIPGGPTGQLILEQIGDIGGEPRRYKQRAKDRESSERASEQQTPWRKIDHPSPLGAHLPCQLDFSTFDGSGMDAPTEPCSADAWSRLYEDCIESFSDDGGGVMSYPGSKDGPENTPTDKQTPDHLSMSRGIRNSTAEFKEEQYANEVSSKDGLLKLVEQAWGNSS
ncbi:hypothetical protein AJ78_01145 [Emergomyces pasteurianus Ep9510]|uniref:Uncharacterized protein n=1 Tax=Emergomyces pasteurianus Ep9510 TaxID=1447872 RepID=A0A1J9PSK9_9EURO|nr:hypothetical protein AJ78_01145 [Emergomyces pasteurianus Ep9510]